MVEVVATIKFQHRSVLEILKDADQFGVYISNTIMKLYLIIGEHLQQRMI